MKSFIDEITKYENMSKYARIEPNPPMMVPYLILPPKLIWRVFPNMSSDLRKSNFII